MESELSIFKLMAYAHSLCNLLQQKSGHLDGNGVDKRKILKKERNETNYSSNQYITGCICFKEAYTNAYTSRLEAASPAANVLACKNL